MGLTIAVEPGRRACADSVVGFVAAADGFTEWELLGASRCHGWTRLDVVVHVLAGWQEMLGGFVSPVAAEPTVDAASYWSAFADEFGSDDPIPTLMAQRRRTAVYSRPASARIQLHDVADALLRGIDAFADRQCTWQGHVFAPGDFMAIWAVENVIHQLDLLSDQPVPTEALHMARQTVEALVGEPFAASMPDLSDEAAVLIGSGRLPVPEALAGLATRLPALS